jgi:mTERF domain-containing protein
VLQISEEMVGRKMEFLIKEAGCDKLHLVRNKVLLTLSLEKRLIPPRSLVRKLLESKGLPVAKKERNLLFLLCNQMTSAL